jgi:P-type E1-E2 ATPase
LFFHSSVTPVSQGGVYLEALGRVQVIALDKTGTLTEGCFAVAEFKLLRCW